MSSAGSVPETHHGKALEQMIERQLKTRGITNSQLLSAFLKVPRHLFVPAEFQNQAYEDHPVQIGYQQTISQPYIVAFMLERLELKKSDIVLEIGMGSGYQTALLAELTKEVYSIEIIPELYQRAQQQLNFLGYTNVYLKQGDGRTGWKEKGPFDKMILSAAAPQLPGTLISQLKENGLVIAPLGLSDQTLVLSKKTNGVLVSKELVPVRFVPLTESK